MIITLHLGIELTQRCNLDCHHCFRGESYNLNISREILEKVFDEVKFVSVLDLSGGEVFLAYDELKMVLEVAKEKNCTIENCSLLTNGTIYDERIYKLLDEYFGDNYQVGVSDDDFHDKSIKRIYGNSDMVSNNPDLHPVNAKEAYNNMYKHYFHPKCVGYHRVSNHLIENGRAISTNTPHKKFEAMGYYYQEFENDIIIAGPMIFVGADGYISDINSDIKQRNEQSIGNIKEIKLSDAIKRGGIEIKGMEPQDFFDRLHKRETEFATHQGDHLIFENNKMAYTTYEPDTKYNEEMKKIDDMLKGFLKVSNYDEFIEYINSLDFSSYPEDLSQIDHEIPMELKYKDK